MPPFHFSQSSQSLSGRYLSFAEREEIAILRVQEHGVCAIARKLGRAPSTISRELRRNAATRGGGLEYRFNPHLGIFAEAGYDLIDHTNGRNGNNFVQTNFGLRWAF